MAYLYLTLAALIPVIASLLFYYADKKTSFGKISYLLKQIIIGVVFGGIAVVGTEWGIKLNGFVINCRDAAPIAAGLIFGGPAGIIAGIIGGVERWFAVLWGAGAFTRVACSISTVLAGFYAALMRKFMFEDKRPTWGLALGAGVIMEVFHLTMVIITNIEDATKAVAVIDACLLPMAVANGLSIMLSVMMVAIYAGDYSKGKASLFSFHRNRSEKPIFETIQQWLLMVLTLSFAVTMIFQAVLQTNMIDNEAEEMIDACIDEISKDIEDTSDAYMLQLSNQIAREVAFGYKYNLQELCDEYDFTEISLVDSKGIIVESNNPDYIGFDMRSGEQSEAFLCLLEDKDKYVQAYGPIAQDDSVYRKFAGIAIRNHTAFVQTGYDDSSFQYVVSQQVENVATNKHIGLTGGVLILDKNFRVVSATSSISRKELNSADFSTMKDAPNDGVVRIVKTDTMEAYMESTFIEGYYVLAYYPVEEAQVTRKVSLYVSIFSMLLIFFAMFILIYMLIRKIVVNQILKMANSLAVISSGNLDEVVDVRSNEEFSSLSDDINATVDTLKHYIAEAAARIDKELEFAKSIQMSALPQPANMNEHYDIYAFMDTAKEVGGDFYDFYQTRENMLHFLIADVSGKGIPAAMFMMRAKSVLKSLTERGLNVDDVFTAGNDALCQENDAGMFVTAWQGSMDLDNGQVFFANAGHNLPAVKKKNGKFELVKQKVNLVLGGMEGIPYSLSDMKLEPGDILYLYTDGVTEATNADNELFGEERLIEALNAKDYSNLKELCDGVMEAVDGFVKEADQFDDITMLAVEYKG